MEKEQAIDRHCRSRAGDGTRRLCRAFIPGEPETFNLSGKPPVVRLGPCPQCGGWNVLGDDNKTLGVDESWFEAVEKGLQRVMELDKLRSGLPDTTGALIAETIDFLNAASRSAYEAGRRLIVLKEDSKHGDFLENLEKIGIPERTAWRMMTYARRVANSPTLANLTPVKIELLAGEVEEASEDGDVLGRPIEYWEGLTVREMREEIKKLRELKRKGAKTQDQLMAEKEALAAKVEALERAQLKTPTEAEASALALIDSIVHSLCRACKELVEYQWEKFDESSRKRLLHGYMALEGALITMNNQLMDRLTEFGAESMEYERERQNWEL
jgi:hypothetical protein